MNKNINPNSRLFPFIGFALSLVIFYSNVHKLQSEGRYYLMAFFIAPPLFLLSIGGLINPRITFALRKDVDVPKQLRTVAFLLLIIGFVIGLGLALYPSLKRL